MTQQVEQQGQVEQVEVEETVAEEPKSDPFADIFGDTVEAPKPKTLLEQREEAVEFAISELGDKADTATSEEAFAILKEAGHDFFQVMAARPRQRYFFAKEIRDRQPKPESKGGALADRLDFTADLKRGREVLSSVRYNKDAEEVKELLAELRAVTYAVESKLDEEDDS